MRNLRLIMILLAVWACRKPEKPYPAPHPPTEGNQLSFALGPNYDTTYFWNLLTGQKEAMLRTLWDLRIDSSGRLWLNSALYAFAAEIHDTSLRTLPPDLNWLPDVPDTPAIALDPNRPRFYLIDRDRAGEFYPESQRYWKLGLWQENGKTYLWHAPLDKEGMKIEYPAGESLFRFTPQGLVRVSIPPWHVSFTRYVHPFYDQPIEFRFYPVIGVLLGDNVEGAVVSSQTKPFAAFSADDINQVSFTARRDVIGYDWKRFDFSQNTYTIDTTRYYVLRIAPFAYWKMRFLDFYGPSGEKGIVTVEILPL
ncbi:MAG: hypothetical protein ACUVRD_08030 [Bacteroidia bacterium]